jgi:protein gp37
MAAKSDIEWTDATWTPIRACNRKTGKVGWHCEHATPGCINCYAEGFNERLGTGLPFKPGHRHEIELFLDEQMLLAPLRWKKPRMVFVCSMTDLFADFVRTEWIDRIFAVMALAPQHTFQVLTKRAERMQAYVSDARERLIKVTPGGNDNVSVHTAKAYHSSTQIGGRIAWPLPNVWLGVSTEDQRRADERIPYLRSTPAAVRFVSAEPLLGPIDAAPYLYIYTHSDIAKLECGCSDEPLPFHENPDPADVATPRIDWVIVGGESGRQARPMHPDWARSLRDQCDDAGVPFFFKQWGAWLIGERVRREDGCLDYVNFQDGDEFHVISDGHDIVLCGADDCKVPTHLWREFWADGCGNLAKVVGKKTAGRRLDGVEYNGVPGARA